MNKNKKIISNSIIVLFILLPIIDCLRRTGIKNIELFGFSIIELINIVIILLTTVLTIINLKNNKKEIIPLLGYTIILFIYIGMHNLNILKLDPNIYFKSNTNLITETYYILRVYYMPILLLFTLVKNRDIFNNNFYKKIAKTLICIICLSIILLNIFKLSYATYAATNDEFVKYNIFDFYKSEESSKLLSTRGWFDSANEISAILMMLFPINIYLLYKENKKINLFLYIIQFLAMIILGTRTSALGAILITIVAILINIFSKLIKQNEINYKLIICGLLCTMYFFISPVGIYLLDYSVPNYNVKDEHNNNLNNIVDDIEISNYIIKHLYEFRIDEEFIELYPIEDDVQFWKNIALGDRNLNNDSRVIKTTIIKRIKERNNNKNDNILGMGYTLNFMDLERDYVYQYYLFGILGIILIVPQILLLITSGLTILKNIKKINILETLLISMSPLVGLVAAYYSGHVFGWISPSYILILSFAILNYICKEGNNKNEMQK